jgi:asparagine synthase (glutamine-hydrolysing)
MRDAIVHRGPDGNGEYEAPGVSLAACRLAIVDLEPRGLMPMSTPDGRYTIVHNGEIYNRLELRDDLERRGVQLLTTTDTEVSVQLYALEGERMLDRLDGMFAFAIWDSANRELFAARDRIGEKPFHHAIHEGRFFFASEPKGLFAAGVPRRFDESTWAELLTFRGTAGPRTTYVGVERLLPAHWLRAGAAGVRTGQWWHEPTSGPTPTKEEFKDLLEASVRRRLIADVPVGTLLSGGIDSSAVTAVAAAQSPRRLSAFTVRYEGYPNDEGEYSTAVAEMVGVDHHEIRATGPQQPTLLADATWYADEPLAFQAMPDMLAVSRYASRHVRVLLTGESSDELFGGYGRFRLLRYPRLVNLAGRVLSPLHGRLRHGSRYDRAVSSTRLSKADWIAASYADGDITRYSTAPLKEWAPYRVEVADQAVRAHADPVRQALAYERLTHLPMIVGSGDRMTMGAALEARLPFSDPRFLEYAALARTRDLFSGPHGKQPLREAMVGRLPNKVIQRRKRGWTSPYMQYLREVPQLRSWLLSTADHPLAESSGLGRRWARDVIDGYLNGDDFLARDSWLIGRVVLWHQVCIEDNRNPFNGTAP